MKYATETEEVNYLPTRLIDDDAINKNFSFRRRKKPVYYR